MGVFAGYTLLSVGTVDARFSKNKKGELHV